MEISDNEIHIWSAKTDSLTPQLLQAYRTLMSEEELTRNSRYRFERDRDRDCLTRALARTVLSEYTSIDPSEWKFVKGEHGKPEVSNAAVPIRFNLSHTGQYVVCAISRDQDIGIDIEHTKRKNDVRSIADHYFSQQEIEDLFKLDYEQQADRFFDYWTLKEAYMKARGEGISLGLGNFSFDLKNRENIGISFGSKLTDKPEHWRFWLFHPDSEHRMALAFRLSDTRLLPTIRQFDKVPLTHAGLV